jgi:hypothetical protein
VLKDTTLALESSIESSVDKIKIVCTGADFIQVGKLWQNCRYAVTILYVAITVTACIHVRCDWMRCTKTMGSHFNVTKINISKFQFDLGRGPQVY